jgi:alkanesulfonate monooxygenase SsuD/methylene tetrahydromethanopterin reductase-like flavin-dependent oxidoreductase (luciferase family)
MVGVGVVVLPQERWLAGARERWQQLEAWGFDHAWTYDHLAWRSLADEPWFATVPLLSAVAAVTEGIGLGTFVASPNFRHPVPFGKDVLGLDDVSGGRLLLGLGAGGEGFDAGVIGAAPTRGERTRRFEEFVDVLDRLLTQPVTDHRGEFYEAHGARMIPVPVRRPPFLLAAAGPRTMALAARRGDGWVTYGAAFGPEQIGDDVEAAQERWWDQLELAAREMDAAEAAEGRAVPLRRYLNLDGAPIFSLVSADVAIEGIERAAALGFTDVVVHWPRDEGIYAGPQRALEDLAAALPRLRTL